MTLRSSTPSAELSRRNFATGLLAGGVLLACPGGGAHAQAQVRARVFRTPGCSCCMGWVRHLQANKFTAEVINQDDLSPTKTRLGVPRDLESCHSAEIDGYVVEGHVPAPAIRTLLALRPAFVGLAVPGMPIGSPGMEGPNPERYDVIAWRPDGSRSVFMRF
ncbi:MAG: DUF411 domain-containing protein [Alphaproteobacteria bacterium]|nr:DUF411 domain-containing protein [Alphaproteobacteria bacterium]